VPQGERFSMRLLAFRGYRARGPTNLEVAFVRHLLHCIALVTGLSIPFPYAVADEKPIGTVRTYQPEAILSRQGSELDAVSGSPVHVGDRILTRRTGSIGIVFIDGSVLSLGPASEFVIDELTFRPAEKDVSFLSRMQRGTASFLSGAIGRIAPEAVRFKTPTATLGFRGTKVLIEVD